MVRDDSHRPRRRRDDGHRCISHRYAFRPARNASLRQQIRDGFSYPGNGLGCALGAEQTAYAFDTYSEKRLAVDLSINAHAPPSLPPKAKLLVA
jgi:hypothetical protein